MRIDIPINLNTRQVNADFDHNLTGTTNYNLKNVYLILIFTIILILIHFTLMAFSFFRFDSVSATFRLVYAIFIFTIFFLIDSWFNFNFEARHYASVMIILALSFVLEPLYWNWFYYDKVLHFFEPMFVCSILFYTLRKQKINLNLKLIFVFFIMAGMIGILEVNEYTFDYLFDLKLQGVYLGFKDLGLLSNVMNSLQDTHIDMVCGYLGSAIYLAVLGRYTRQQTLNRQI